MERSGWSIELVEKGVKVRMWGPELKKAAYRNRFKKIKELAKDGSGAHFEYVGEECVMLVLYVFDENGEPKVGKRLKNHIEKVLDDFTSLLNHKAIKLFVK